MEHILLLVGTNVGNVQENLLQAEKELEKNKIRIVKKSKIYKTKPWGDLNQPDFLNRALEVECVHSPQALLRILKNIETRMGRRKSARTWGPRTIDIDILFYGDRIMKTRNLVIPHKEFFNRPFAIKLLAEIAPDFMPPRTTKTLREYVKGVGDEGLEVYCD